MCPHLLDPPCPLEVISGCPGFCNRLTQMVNLSLVFESLSSYGVPSIMLLLFAFRHTMMFTVICARLWDHWCVKLVDYERGFMRFYIQKLHREMVKLVSPFVCRSINVICEAKLMFEVCITRVFV